MTRPPTRSYSSYAATPGRRSAPRPRQLDAWLVFLARAGLILGLLALLALPLVTALGTYAYFQVSGRIIPGVRVGDTRLGGLTPYDAAVRLNQAWNLERRIGVGVLIDGEARTWAVPPSQLGLSLDYLRSAQNAYAIAHGQDLLTEVDQMTASAWRGWQVTPIIQFDPEAARAGLQVLSDQVGRAPVDADLRLEGGDLVAVSGTPGSAIDIETGLHKLAADPGGVMTGGYLTLTMIPVEPRITDVSAAMQTARELLDARVVIRAYDALTEERFEWQLDRETVASWLQLESSAQGVDIGIDQQKVAEYLRSLSDGLGSERAIDVEAYREPLVQALRQGGSLTLDVDYNPTSYVVQPGDSLLGISWEVGMPYWKILEANPGLDQDRLLAGQELVIPAKTEMLPLPVVEGKRVIIGISQQRLWVYEDGEQIGEHVISTGIDRSPTQPGVFQIQTHDRNAYASVWDLNMPHFLGIYEAWPGFMNGIHGLPTLSNGRRLWAGVLGRPVSYGCIVMELDAAEWLYEWGEDGVVVEIEP
ncbi:MAG TPA: L,D-transpeptidase family protein [Anaerolineales bacterium]